MVFGGKSQILVSSFLEHNSESRAATLSEVRVAMANRAEVDDELRYPAWKRYVGFFLTGSEKRSSR